MKKEKKSKKKSNLLFTIVTGLFSGVGTFLLLAFIDKANNYDEETFFPLILMAISGALVSTFVHTFIHELGHLIFGLMTGYKFSSFRIGNKMLIKSEGKFKICKYELAGTGGQCLLAPPENKDKKPYVLYNLGGIFFNIITAVILIAIIPLCGHIIAKTILAGSALGGIITAVTNGIPSSVIDNDGSNTLAISKDPYAVDAFYNQMKINYYISAGKTLKEIPLELFELPENANLNNKIISAIAVQKCNIYMDNLEFEKAYAEMKNLLNSDATLATIYEHLLKMECAYCELVGENRKDVVDEFLNKDVKKTMKAMGSNPSIVRFLYVYELFYNNNEDEANKFLEKFEKVAKTFPYTALLDNERALLNYAQNRYSACVK